jgi:DNA sulfur modification protein DndD
MNINKLVLFNYGPFREANTIVFSDKQRKADSSARNIILIGGKNGSGKTSLFTALQVCLYGQSSLGPRTSRRSYEDFLRDQIHRRSDSLFIVDTASIALDFNFSICGNTDNYVVKRTWQVRSDKELVETLAVIKNGKPLDTYEEYHWQDFVKYLIPQGLLKLFFFDGERINALTSENDAYELKYSVQSLFGLDIIKQLKADLRYVERKKMSGANSKEILSRLSDIEKNIQAFIHKIEDCDATIASLIQQVDSISRNISLSEDKLRTFGGQFADSRDNIRVRILTLEGLIEEKTKELRSLFQRELPFSYSSSLMKQTSNKIIEELGERKTIKYKEEFDASWRFAKKKIAKYLLSIEHVNQIYLLLTARISGNKYDHIFSDLSDKTLNEIHNWFDKTVHEQKNQAKNIACEIEKFQTEKDGLAKKLEYVPANEDFSVYIEKLNCLSKKKGEAEGAIAASEANKRELINSLEALKREMGKLEIEISDIAKNDRRLGIIDKSIRALDIFESVLLGSKIKALEENVLVSLNKLLRKSDIIKKIRISKDDFGVFLEDSEGRYLDKKQLSEGEKQIYAVSLLAGITRTTKRAFPVFFDTPLGRLDSDHRMNIIHNYFPFASHQLIILSTDTEIDRQYFEEIRPYIACSYLLDFDSQNKCSNIMDGYFWR